MSARKRINKTKFHAINRDVKVPGSKVKAIASVHNVSEETVRTIKRAKTWPRFEAMKKLKNERRRPTTPGVPLKAVPVQQALTNVQRSLNPTEELDKITQAPENQIRPDTSEEIKIVTVAEWNAVNRKIAVLKLRLDRMTPHNTNGILGIFRRAK